MMRPSAAPIYLDYHATTPVDSRVAEVVLHHMTTAFGNASSADHYYGDEAEEAVALARAEVAQLVGANPEHVLFTSGATESINLAIRGFLRARREAGAARIVVSPVEHSAVLETCRAVAREGGAVLYELSVDKHGRIDLAEVQRELSAGADLLCVMAANNEIGNLYPVADLGSLAQAHGTAFLCDATQAAGKVPLADTLAGVTFLVCSAHKLYGPKGVGALVVSDHRLVDPMTFGGEQERGLRPGTLNVPGIAGFGEACRLRRLEMTSDEHMIAARRDRLQRTLVDDIDGLTVNGDTDARLAGSLHVSVPDMPNSVIIARLRNRVAIATGAACSSGVDAPSHVLRAMRLPDPVIEGALRISLGKFTSDEDVILAAEHITEAVRDARQALEFWR